MRRQKYFYTILFLDDYYVKDNLTQISKTQTIMQKSELKKFRIYPNGTDSESVKWINNSTVSVKHGLKMPITLQMWNDKKESIFYAPIIKDAKNNITLGDVSVSGDLLYFNFNKNNPAPTISSDSRENYYTLSIRTLPGFDTQSLRNVSESEIIGQSLNEIIKTTETPDGLAIIFRRKTMDMLFDLIQQFDETYWHSDSTSADLKYLTNKTLYKKCSFTCKYTQEIQDVLDLIDTTKFEIKYSWEE